MKSKLLSYLLIPKAYLSFEISKSRLLHTDGKVYVINTCSRGIGHEFCRQLLHRSAESSKVIGLYRTKTRQLEELDNESNGKLQLVNMDIESQTSIDEAVIKISKLTKKVDLLINSAGILGDGKTVPGPERSISGIERSWLNKSFEVFLNSLKHVLVNLYLHK
jgi:NAD(P)-dependent dehydrogenase (short-subunit alcohol dehydrogenase family)